VKDHTIIIGGGPAGLTAAHELGRLGRSAIVLEKDDVVGGLSRTVSHNGYRFDIGGHRFYTKIDAINQLWHELLGDDFLERPRLSRIFYNDTFFNYPLRPVEALSKLGPVEATRIIASYIRAQAMPSGSESSFEDWVVSRFGQRLFEVFFKSYTEKVWGIPCNQISADWAAQRIKNMNLTTAIKNALLGHSTKDGEVVSTLIDRFHYPRLGPGMMWERCRERTAELGVDTLTGAKAIRIRHSNGRVTSVDVDQDGQAETMAATDVVSSMPIPSLIRALDPPPPRGVLEAADALRFRDFLTVVLVIDRQEVFPDNWIYIHSPKVRVGRVQNFKNWSPDMVPDQALTSLGLEYFVQEGDELWTRGDKELRDLGIQELESLGLIDGGEVIDHAVVRVPKAYPVYDQNYESALETARTYLDQFTNLHLIGRNGQHRYNNMDHSMLTGILAARNVAGADHNLWEASADKAYLEESADPTAAVLDRAVPRPTREPDFADTLASVFARYDAVALGTALGLVSGAIVMLATAVLLLRGGDPLGPTLSLLGHYLLGFEVSWLGGIIGSLEACAGGFVFGFLLARIINLLVDLTLKSVIRQCQLEGVLDLMDAGNPH
jgi:protoporphyrinogen oxidase